MTTMSAESTIYLVTTVVIFLLAILTWRYRKCYNYWKKRNVPFLSPIFPFGNGLDLLLGKVTYGEFFSKAYLEFQRRGCKHGGIYCFWQPIYIPVDPEIVKKIVISDFENFSNHGMYISSQDDLLSQHLFNMENKRWKVLRTKLPSIFTSAKMRKMYLLMEKYSQLLVDQLDKYAEKDVPLDIKSEITKFTTDIISECGFGLETKTMQNENKELMKHSRKFFDYQWHVLRNILVLIIPRNILQFFKFRIFPKDTENFMMDFFKSIKDYRDESNDKRHDLTDTMIQLTKKDMIQKDFTGKEIIEPASFEEFGATMFLFFSAGFETSSSTQTFALYELAKNANCQNLLRTEIETVLAKHNGELTYDAIMDMKYLDQVIDETLRLYPVFPIMPRVCKGDYPIPGTDVVLEKDTIILVSNLGIQRDPDYFPNPEKFMPERFSKENKWDRPFISHMPFGEGPRICVGKRFGLLQSKLGLITIIRNYEVTLNGRTKEGFKFASKELILRKDGDVWISLKKIST